VAGLALAVAFAALPHGSLPASIVDFAGAALLAVSAVVGLWKQRQPRAVRWLLGGAWVVNAVAFAWWSFMPLVTGRPLSFPSPADILWLVTNVLLVCGLVAVGRLGGRGNRRGAAIDALIITLAVATVSWAFIVQPLLTAAEGTVDAPPIAVAYAVGDLLTLGVLMWVWFLRAGRPRGQLLFAGGILVFLVANESYTAGLLSASSGFASWYDDLYLVSYALIGAGLLHPSLHVRAAGQESRERALNRGRLTFLAVAAVLPPCVINGERLVGNLGAVSRTFLTFVGAVMALLVLERMRGLLVDISQHRELQRLKNEFTSVVSHELRTPLTSIRGSLGLMAGGALGAMPPDAQRMLDIAVDNTDRLVRLVNDILDLERIESGEVAMRMEPSPAAEIVLEAVREMEGAAAQAGVVLEAHVAPVLVMGDRDRLVQTLVNLIGNAIKFSPAGAAVRAHVARAGNHGVFQVEDEGRGIPADKLETIFQAFEQVDASDSREKGGTGLGLAICRMIVERHGGRIWAQSVADEGSTLAFTVPALAESAPVPDDARPTVLVCGDDASVREVTSAMLARRGYRVVAATSGDEALRLALQERPSAVLLDLLTPGFSGWETIGSLRRRPETSSIPVIIVSVMPPEAGREGDAWSEQPVDQRSLFAALESALRPGAGDGNVLLVEDDADLAAVLLARLDALGIRAVHAGTVAAAIELGGESVPDLLVLDLGLPDGDGLDVVTAPRLHDTLNSVPTRAEQSPSGVESAGGTGVADG
jgi:signal transduction histidine kinase/DNA-binding response OmpR family regulator